MNIEPCIPTDCSITEATLRVYALRVIASESSQDFPQIACLPLETRLQEDLGIWVEGRLRIIHRLRDAFGSEWAAPDLTYRSTLGQLMQSLAPPTFMSHV